MLSNVVDNRRHILAVVDGHRDSSTVLARAAEFAACLSEQWTAVHLSLAGTDSNPEVVGAAFENAIQSGADVLEIPAEDEFSAISTLIAERRPSYTFLNSPLTGKRKIAVRRNWQSRLLEANLPTTLVLVEALAEPNHDPLRLTSTQHGLRAYLLALIAVILTVPCVLILYNVLGPNGLSLLFLLPVIVVAQRLGTAPALFASVASGLSFSIFILRGSNPFSQAAAQTFFVMSALIAVGSYIAMITGKMRARMMSSDRVAKQNGRLAAFGMRLAQADSWETTSREICAEISDALSVQAALFRPTSLGFDVIHSSPSTIAPLGPLDIASRASAWEHEYEAGAGTRIMNAASWRFQPLMTSLGRLAILGIARDDGGDPIEEQKVLLYRSLINQSSLACERLHLENLNV